MNSNGRLCACTVIMRTVMCALVLAHVCQTEPFFLSRDHSDINLHAPREENTEKVQNEADCEMYLCDYGYLNCSCQARTIRHKNERRGDRTSGTPVVGFPMVVSELDQAAEDSIINPNVLPNCTASEITEGYIRLQKRFQLQETGRCDPETKIKMNKRRCGNKDMDLMHENELDHADRPGVTLASILRPKKQNLTTSTGTGAHERRKREVLEEMRRKDEYMRVNGLQRRVDRPEDHVNRLERSARKKRSATSLLAKTCIKWRLSSTYQSTKIPEIDQRFALSLAFRLWSEVTPLRFEEDLTSHMDDVDVFIAFVYDDHLNCIMSFDGPRGVLAHVVRQDSPQNSLGDIHFDDAEPFVKNHSPSGVSLLLVAAHEIGHVLGLFHLPQVDAIMFGEYENANTYEIELSDVDRHAIKDRAGVCKGSFDTVFDYVRMEGRLVYNTYFMRGDQYWLYQNVDKRPRYGDPLKSFPYWGVTNVDAFLQVFITNTDHFSTQCYFFVGEQVAFYDAVTDQVTETKPINEKWPGMYTNIDSAFFDKRDNNIYIFKDDKVQIWSAATNTLLRNTTICEQFPPMPSVDNLDYCQGIDAAYFSFATKKQTFFRGEEYWVNINFNIHTNVVNNQMGPSNKWYHSWQFICDVYTSCST